MEKPNRDFAEIAGIKINCETSLSLSWKKLPPRYILKNKFYFGTQAFLGINKDRKLVTTQAKNLEIEFFLVFFIIIGQFGWDFVT